MTCYIERYFPIEQLNPLAREEANSNGNGLVHFLGQRVGQRAGHPGQPAGHLSRAEKGFGAWIKLVRFCLLLHFFTTHDIIKPSRLYLPRAMGSEGERKRDKARSGHGKSFICPLPASARKARFYRSHHRAAFRVKQGSGLSVNSLPPGCRLGCRQNHYGQPGSSRS